MEVKYTDEEIRILATPICELNASEREVLTRLLKQQGVDIVIMDGGPYA